ncbi:MAG: hypothetical protein DLM69_09955 [Candidatus Chloroheliales bacterium]|nr:MAG: hypothetical protein DLM69_09955 [Chloroflexota bacterium]
MNNVRIKDVIESKAGVGNAAEANLPDFETFWQGLTAWLKKKRYVRNWTVCNSYFGKDFEAWYMPERDLVRVEDIRVRKKSFQLVYEAWAQYLARKISRKELCSKDFFTTYTISILKEYFETHPA